MGHKWNVGTGRSKAKDTTRCCKKCRNGVALAIGVQCKIQGILTNWNGRDVFYSYDCTEDNDVCSDFNKETRFWDQKRQIAFHTGFETAILQCGELLVKAQDDDK